MVLRIHPAVRCRGWVRFSGRSRLVFDARSSVNIGRGVRIHSGATVNPVGGGRLTILATGSAGQLVLGDGVGISGSIIFATCRIEIGARSMIGGGCEVYDSDFHSLDPVQRQAARNPGVVSRAVVIEEDVFVGTGVMILKGSRLGARSVIGARAVIAGQVPPDAVWVGNPARQIRLCASQINKNGVRQ